MKRIGIMAMLVAVAAVVAFSAIASAEEIIPIEGFKVVEDFPSQIIAGSTYEAHYRFNCTANEPIPVTMYFGVGGPDIGPGEWSVGATVNGADISVLENGENAGSFILSYEVAARSTNDVIIQVSSLPNILPAAYTFTMGLWSRTVWVAPPPPEKATLTITTTPIAAEVFVGGVSWGTAPQSRSVDPGTYTVSFGAVSGYVTPPAQTVTLAAGETRTVTGTYAAAAPDFAISVSPASGSAVQGGSAGATVSITSIGGFTDTVSLSASGLPSGATTTFSPSPGAPSFTSALAISTSATTPSGAYTITITGTGGGKTHSCEFALTITTVVVPGVPDFSMEVSPTSGSVAQGGARTATVSVSPIEGFAERVSLFASGLPSGATSTFSPSPGTPSFDSTLTISTSPTTPAGTYTVTITGTGGGKTHACAYELTVTLAVPIPPDIIEVESPPVEIPFIDPDVPQDVAVEDTNITGLTIDTLEAVENVRIVVQQLTDMPATISIGPPGLAYQYFNIVVENLSDAQIESVTIRFRVEKSWIAQNGIDIQTIALNRYDPATGEWTPLPTTFLSQDGIYAYFSAVSPGLSVFGISGLPTTTTTPPPTTTTPPPIPLEVGILGVGILIIAVIVTLGLLGVGPFRRKHKHRGRE